MAFIAAAHLYRAEHGPGRLRAIAQAHITVIRKHEVFERAGVSGDDFPAAAHDGVFRGSAVQPHMSAVHVDVLKRSVCHGNPPAFELNVGRLAAFNAEDGSGGRIIISVGIPDAVERRVCQRTAGGDADLAPAGNIEVGRLSAGGNGDLSIFERDVVRLAAVRDAEADPVRAEMLEPAVLQQDLRAVTHRAGDECAGRWVDSKPQIDVFRNLEIGHGTSGDGKSAAAEVEFVGGRSGVNIESSGRYGQVCHGRAGGGISIAAVEDRFLQRAAVFNGYPVPHAVDIGCNGGNHSAAVEDRYGSRYTGAAYRAGDFAAAVQAVDDRAAFDRPVSPAQSARHRVAVDDAGAVVVIGRGQSNIVCRTAFVQVECAAVADDGNVGRGGPGVYRDGPHERLVAERIGAERGLDAFTEHEGAAVLDQFRAVCDCRAVRDMNTSESIRGDDAGRNRPA